MQVRYHLERLGVVAVFSLLACAVVHGQQVAPKKRVAVLNFDNPSVGPDAPSGMFGANGGDVGKGVSVLLIQKLVEGGKYTVVDRSALEKLLKEQSADENEHMDAYQLAAKIGRMVGLDAMIIGAVTRYGVDETNKKATGTAGSFVTGMKTRRSKAYVDITARIFNVTTGQAESSFTGSGESSRAGEIMVMPTRGKSATSLEMLGSDFVETLFSEATGSAVEQLATQLNAFAEKVPTLRLKIEARVAEVSGKSLTLNVGSKGGLKTGQQLSILRDPLATAASANGGGLVPLPERIGTAIVTEVGEGYATAEFSGSREPKVGDVVRDANALPAAE
jgi:curli biogenesis system outer membrane secretion channel CsgG